MVETFGGFKVASVRQLLADAKFGKDHTKQVIRAEFPCDLIERVLRKAQFLGQQIEGLRLCRQVCVSKRQVRFHLP